MSPGPFPLPHSLLLAPQPPASCTLPARRLSPRGCQWPGGSGSADRQSSKPQTLRAGARCSGAPSPRRPAGHPESPVEAGDGQAGPWRCAALASRDARLARARALGSPRASVCRLEIAPCRAGHAPHREPSSHVACVWLPTRGMCERLRTGPGPTSSPWGLEAAATLVALPRPAGLP